MLKNRQIKNNEIKLVSSFSCVKGRRILISVKVVSSQTIPHIKQVTCTLRFMIDEHLKMLLFSTKSRKKSCFVKMKCSDYNNADTVVFSDLSKFPIAINFNCAILILSLFQQEKETYWDLISLLLWYYLLPDWTLFYQQEENGKRIFYGLLFSFFSLSLSAFLLCPQYLYKIVSKDYC